MKASLLRLAAVVGLSIGALALPTTAFAGGGGGSLCGPGGSGQVMNCHFSGLFAQAEYRAVSSDNIYTDVAIGAMNGRSLEAGSVPPDNQSSAYISISKVTSDPANPYGKPIVLVSLWGSIPLTSGLSMDKNLSTARLESVQIPVSGFDGNGAVDSRIVTVNATWTGIGDISHSTFTYSFRSGGYMYRERSKSAFRNAAVSTSAFDGSREWLSGLDLVFANLQSASDATLTISRA